MNLALGVMAMGILPILGRRPMARGMVRSQEFWFDRAYDVDSVAWWYGAVGGLVATFGVVFAAIDLFGN